MCRGERTQQVNRGKGTESDKQIKTALKMCENLEELQGKRQHVAHSLTLTSAQKKVHLSHSPLVCAAHTQAVHCALQPCDGRACGTHKPLGCVCRWPRPICGEFGDVSSDDLLATVIFEVAFHLPLYYLVSLVFAWMCPFIYLSPHLCVPADAVAHPG